MNGQSRHREGRIATNKSILQRLDPGAASLEPCQLADDDRCVKESLAS